MIDAQSRTEVSEPPDTLIVGAKEESFIKHFINERSWYPVRIDSNKLLGLKWIAVYQSRPYSAITHLAKILSIRQYMDSGRYQIDFEEPEELRNQVRLDPGSTSGLQGQRYSWKRKVEVSRFISDLKPWA